VRISAGPDRLVINGRIAEAAWVRHGYMRFSRRGGGLKVLPQRIEPLHIRIEVPT
jgi:hypothetical protein